MRILSPAVADLILFVKEEFIGNNEVFFLISERGNQRIEIKDLDTGEIWETLECTEPSNIPDDYEDIAAALLSKFVQEMPMS